MDRLTTCQGYKCPKSDIALHLQREGGTIHALVQYDGPIASDQSTYGSSDRHPQNFQPRFNAYPTSTIDTIVAASANPAPEHQTTFSQRAGALQSRQITGLVASIFIY
jgi:hypothetical protein